MTSLIRWTLVILFALAGCIQVGCGPVDVSSPDDRAASAQQDNELGEVPGSEPPELNLDALVRVTVAALGLTAVEIETLVTMPIETALSGIPGVENVQSVSREGESTVWVRFGPKSDALRNRQLVAERLDSVVDLLPEAAEGPCIAPGIDTLALLVVLRNREPGAEGVLSDIELRSLARRVLVPRLSALRNVSQVSVFGGRRERYEIVVDPARLAQYGLTWRETAEAIRRANTDAPIGVISPEVLIRTVGSGQVLEDLEQIVLVMRQGTPVLLRDVAQVRVGTVGEADGLTSPRDPVLIAIHSRGDETATAGLSAEIDEVLGSPQLPPSLECLRDLPPELDWLVLRSVARLHRDVPLDLKFYQAKSADLHWYLKLEERDDLEIRVFGPDLDVPGELVEQVRQKLFEAQTFGFSVSLNGTTPQVKVEIDRDKIARYGISAGDVNRVIRAAMSDEVVCRVREDGWEKDVVLMSALGERDSAEDLAHISIALPDGGRVPLSEIANITLVDEPMCVWREQLRRYVTIHVFSQQPRRELNAALRKALAPLEAELPQGYSIEY
ncbi:MAG: efflux RND transporter permease subunit [Planctomycetes bacterium]|nr:efflux RND transporter permease subunit [Planctomycetota bacterium]